MSAVLRLLPRLLALLSMALWWGGLCFYALVVVPVGAHVLGSHTAQGFITREVTPWLNVAGSLAVLGSLPPVLQQRGRVTRVAWLLMAAAQASLFGLHRWTDSYLDTASRAVLEAGAFYAVHRAYLLVSAVQWLACGVCAAGLLAAWHRDARLSAPPSGPSVS